MKILHLCKFYPPYAGGIEQVCFDICEGLSDKDHQLDVLCFNHEKGITRIKAEKKKHYTIYRAKVDYKLDTLSVSFSYIQWFIKNHKAYHAIHIHFPNPIADLAFLLSNFKGKVIVHWHNDLLKGKLIDFIYGTVIWRLLKKTDHVIVTSPNYLEGSKYLRANRQKTTVVPIGIHLKRLKKIDYVFLEKIQKEFKEKKIVFSIGRHVPLKGFRYLVEAARFLPENYVVLIAGDGPSRKKSEEIAHSLGLERKVRFLGFLPEAQKNAYLQAASVFVLSSISKGEAFGIVQLEAMHFSTPIVATKIEGSGVSWVNQNGYSGINVAPMQPKEIAEAIQHICSNQTTYNYFASGAKENLSQRFSAKKMTETIAKLYFA